MKIIIILRCVTMVFIGVILLSGCNIDIEPIVPEITESDPTELTLHSSGESMSGQNPAKILISDTPGQLYELDLQTLTLTTVHQFETGGNFDIQYTGPFEILVANFANQRIDRFNLRTKELKVLVEGPPLSNPIGLAVSPKGVLYIADHNGMVFSFDLRTKLLDLLADHGPDGEFFNSPDGIVVDHSGKKVIFCDHSGKIYCITPLDKKIMRIATIPGAELNGISFLTHNEIVVASQDFPPAIFRINVESGQVMILYQGTPFRNPEDVAVDPQRKKIYIMDSDFKRSYPDYRPGIYVFDLTNETLETLIAGDPLCCDLVDILLRPFTSFQ